MVLNYFWENAYLRSMTNAVTLSVEPSIIASWHNFFPIDKKSCELLRTNFATVSLFITSHKPSEAMTRYSSSAAFGFSIISGWLVIYGCNSTSPIALQNKKEIHYDERDDKGKVSKPWYCQNSFHSPSADMNEFTT